MGHTVYFDVRIINPRHVTIYHYRAILVRSNHGLFEGSTPTPLVLCSQRARDSSEAQSFDAG